MLFQKNQGNKFIKKILKEDCNKLLPVNSDNYVHESDKKR